MQLVFGVLLLLTGISVVELAGIDGAIVHVRNVDMVDGTPLLDLKPYVPEFEGRGPVLVGWLSGRLNRLDGARSDGRFDGSPPVRSDSGRALREPTSGKEPDER